MRYGWGFFIGIFLLIWGSYELLQSLGILPSQPKFPGWPIALVLIGLAMVLRRLGRH